MEEKCRIS